MALSTTAQRLIDFRNELSNSGRGFGEDLLDDMLRDASKALIDSEGLITGLDLPSEQQISAPPGSPEGVGESKSPA